MELVAAFQSTIIYLMVAIMSSFNLSPEIKVATVDAATRAVVMALRSSEIPVTYEGVEHDLRKDTISINNIKLHAPLPLEGGCESIEVSGRKDPKTLFYEKLPCKIDVLIGDITIHGLQLAGNNSETTSIQVNNVVIDLSPFSSGQMLAIKRILQLEDELTIKGIGIGLGYDLASDQITAEFRFGVEGFGSIEAVITLSSIRQDNVVGWEDEITGQLERVELVITDEGMIETVSMLTSMSTDNKGINLANLVTPLFDASPLEETSLGDLTEVYPNSDQNISELAKFMAGNMTLSCVRENPHQILFTDDFIELGPTALFNILCERVSTYK